MSIKYMPGKVVVIGPDSPGECLELGHVYFVYHGGRGESVHEFRKRMARELSAKLGDEFNSVSWI